MASVRKHLKQARFYLGQAAAELARAGQQARRKHCSPKWVRAIGKAASYNNQASIYLEQLRDLLLTTNDPPEL